MRIVIVIGEMGYHGGAQRVTALQVNYWASIGWEVSIISLLEPSESSPAFPLKSSVQFHSLSWKDLPRSRVPKMTYLKRYWIVRKNILGVKPDVILGITETGAILALWHTFASRVPVIAVEHIDPRQQAIWRPHEWARKLLYPFAASVVCLTEGAMSYFPRFIQKRGRVIPNAFSAPNPGTEPKLVREEGRKYAIYVGRLVATQKRVDRIIEAFSRVASTYPDWDLEIWGEGEEKDNLQQMIDLAGLSDRIVLLGYTESSAAVMMQSHLFLLASEYEGMPLAVGEALAAGVPVISFDCPTGPRELIRDGTDGILVPHRDLEAFVKALDSVMGDEPYRQRLAASAPDIINRLGTESVMSQWARLFESII